MCVNLGMERIGGEVLQGRNRYLHFSWILFSFCALHFSMSSSFELRSSCDVISPPPSSSYFIIHTFEYHSFHPSSRPSKRSKKGVGVAPVSHRSTRPCGTRVVDDAAGDGGDDDGDIVEIRDVRMDVDDAADDENEGHKDVHDLPDESSVAPSQEDFPVDSHSIDTEPLLSDASFPSDDEQEEDVSSSLDLGEDKDDPSYTYEGEFSTMETDDSTRDSEKSKCSSLVGREDESATICTFWKESVLAKRADSLYISGLPGTGKTETMRRVKAEMYGWSHRQTQENIHYQEPLVVEINGMDLAQGDSIYTVLWKHITSLHPAALRCKHRSRNKKEKHTKSLEKYFFSTNYTKMVVAIVDEIDQLIKKDRDTDNRVLYKLFEWSKRKGSRLILIGMANTITLTDDVLPGLKRKGWSPKTLNFAPYDKEQLMAILKHKFSERFEARAIEYCGTIISQASSDIRRAIDWCSQALHAAQENGDELVDIPHLAQTHPNYESMAVKSIRGLPIKQKILVCCYLTLPCHRGKRPRVTMQRLYDVYKRTLQTHGLFEFRDAHGGLSLQEFSRLLKITEMLQVQRSSGKSIANRKILGCSVTLQDMQTAEASNPLLAAMLGCT